MISAEAEICVVQENFVIKKTVTLESSFVKAILVDIVLGKDLPLKIEKKITLKDCQCYERIYWIGTQIHMIDT